MRLLLLVLCYSAFLSSALAECGGRLITKHVHAAPVCVPSDPQRIAILDPFYNLGMAIELGLPVIAAPMLGLQDAWLRAAVEDTSIVDLGDFKQPSLERIVSLLPDLIVGNASSHTQLYVAASRVAPTLLIEDLDWKDHFRLLARAAGRDAVADKALAGYEERVATIRKRMRDITVSVVRIAGNGFIIYPEGSKAFGPYAVLREAGVKRTPIETVTDTTLFKRLDWEELAALESDVLLYYTVDGYDPADYDRVEAETLANPLWQMLPAVRSGRAHRVDRAIWMGFNGVASAHRTLDDIERYILSSP